MNIDQLRYLMEIGRTGSMTKAAQQLFISPQGLIKAIASLEAELGCNLVVRSHHGTTLTSEGRRFMKFAEETVSRFDGIIDDFAAQRREAIRNRPFSMGATSYSFHTVLRKLTETDEYSLIHLEEMAPSAILESLKTAGNKRIFFTDLFEGSSLAEQIRQASSFETVFKTNFGIIYHRDFHVPEGPLSALGLTEFPLVCYRDESMDWIIERTFGAPQPENIFLRTSNFELLFGQVKQARAACLDSFAYHTMASNEVGLLETVLFKPVVDMTTVTIGFAFRKDDADNTVEKLFADEFTASFRREHAAYFKRYPA